MSKPKAPGEFADLLTAAVYRIKANTGKNLDVIEDELGYALGRQGRSFIAYLRRGNLPAEMGDAEELARALLLRQGLDRASCLRLLHSAGHPNPQAYVNQVLPHPNGPEGSQPAAPAPAHPAREAEVFVAGPPVTQPHQFFGRERELKRSFGWWRHAPMSHVALIGPKRSGRTSLTHYLQRVHAANATLRAGQKGDWLPQATRYRWVRIDFQDARMCRLENLLRHTLAELGLPAPNPCNLDRFMDAATDPGHWQRPAIILMDDIGAGLSAPELDRAFWQSLRSLVNSAAEGNLAFCVTAQREPAQLAAEQAKTSPFFNIFNTLELGPFTEAEARELIASSPLPFDPQDAAWVMEQSGRWPALLQLLCQERLLALEDGDPSDAWQREGLKRIAPFRHLIPPSPKGESLG